MGYHPKRTYIFGAVFAFFGLVIGLGFLALFGDDFQRQGDADARVEAAIDLMQKFSQTGDPPGQYFLDVVRLENANEISAEPINRMADLLSSKNWGNREYAAIALEFLGPQAEKANRVVPALKRAIAEELAIWKGRRQLIIGAGPSTLDAELRALGKITDTPFEQLLEHPEQFEKLPPDMEVCMETFNREECDRLLAEWKAAPY